MKGKSGAGNSLLSSKSTKGVARLSDPPTNESLSTVLLCIREEFFIQIPTLLGIESEIAACKAASLPQRRLLMKYYM